MKEKNCIKKEIRKVGETRIPSRMKIEEGENCIKIIMNAKRIQEKNMQEDGNDFEGWGIATYIYSQKKKTVLFDVDEHFSLQGEDYLGKGHLCRFLYRLMKFSEQYKWVKLSTYLESEVKRFRKYLSAGVFVNNIGTGEAGNKNKYDDENAVEAKLAEQGVMRSVIKGVDIGNGNVYRQLPVGLFAGGVKRANSVFTGGKSAIDLWVRNEDTINVVELKTNNPMMGIITEIFFYSNYVYDFLRKDKKLFTLNEIPKGKDNHRGYEEIWNNKDQIYKVNGIMLADDRKFHPWVEKCLEILKDNGIDDLNYYMESYHLNVIIE